ncbi:MAG: 50S ribosomal protein L16 3-hydroxylase [Paraglaciecola sp.]|jgi:50S ribosomal protein L16 3-hydroxylase
MYVLNNIDKEFFLAEVWQKKPLVIRQGFKQFVDPLDEHELAGLAQEDDIDSRIVACDNDKWDVSHGPFDDFENVCLGAWSLLVQSVDLQIPNADALMRAFDFIPHWRMDDLMVSFSNQHAGVGPHFDQYDVFIVQGKGSRRWNVGARGSYSEHFPHPDLRQINDFEPLISEVLFPGDVIYIPPGFPHNGVALEECLNYSIGFRAPSQQEMLSSLADYSIDNSLFTCRYADTSISPRIFPGEIKIQEAASFKALLHQVIDSEHFSAWLASFLSQTQAGQRIEEHQSEQYSQAEIEVMLNSGTTLIRQLATKAVCIEAERSTNEELTYYIEGQSFSVPESENFMVQSFLNSPEWNKKEKNDCHNSIFFTLFVTTLVNAGFWYPA